MDKKRDKTRNKNIIHVKRVLKDKMKTCIITGKSLQFVKLHDKFMGMI